MSLSTPQGPEHLPFVPVTAQTALEDTNSWPSCSELSNVHDIVTNEAEIKDLKKINGVVQCVVGAVKTTAHKKHNESNVAATIENAEPAPGSGETSGKLQRDTPTSAPATDAYTEVLQAYSLIKLRDFHNRAEAERAKEPKADGVNLSKAYRVPTVLVSRDEDLDTKAFTTPWEAFKKRVTHATVAFVGIDTEWEGENSPSLVQIADTEICFLFRSASAPPKTPADAATTPDDATHPSVRISVERLAPLLKPVLTASNIFLCGVEVRGDCTKLQKMGFDTITAPLLELKNLADAIVLQLEGGPSLVNITCAATRLDWRKDKSITTSKWEVPKLSQLQLQYAADDAVAAVAVIAAVIAMSDATDVSLKDDDALRFWVQTVAPAKPKKGTSKGLASKTTASCPSETSEKKKSEVQVLDKQGNRHTPFERKMAQWYVNQRLATVTGWDGKHIAVIELCSDPPAKTNSHGEKELATDAKDSSPPGCDETFEAEEAPLDGATPDVAVIPVVDAQDLSHHPCTTPAAALPAAASPAAAPSVQGTSKFVEVFAMHGNVFGSFNKKNAERHIKKGWAKVTDRDSEGNITAIRLLSDPQVKTNICEPWKQGRCYNGANCTFTHGEAELVTNAKDSSPPPPYAGTGCDETFEAEEAPLDGATPDVAVIPVVDAQDLSHYPCTSHHDGSPNELKNESC